MIQLYLYFWDNLIYRLIHLNIYDLNDLNNLVFPFYLILNKEINIKRYLKRLCDKLNIFSKLFIENIRIIR